MKRWEQAIGMSVVAAVVIGMMMSCRHLETSEKDIADSGDVVVKLGDGITMRLKPIPAGDFTMGSPDDEHGRENGETQHHVTLTKDFWMGETEVTQAQFEAVMGRNPSYGRLKNETYPVHNVAWNDAMAFCRRLTAWEKIAGRLPEGYEYSLPSEAQWEYACRAGTITAYHFGEGLDEGMANYKFNDAWNHRPDVKDDLKEVGSFKPNSLGLYDMHGNVLEWCYDRYGDYSVEAATDPLGVETGWNRVLRGGAWIHDADYCRSACRYSQSPTMRNDFIGFRVALVPMRSKKVLPDDKLLHLPGGVTMKLKAIPAGEFMMGSSQGDSYERDEIQHLVTLTKDFWLGETEVTEAQYEAIMGQNSSQDKKGSEFPAQNVCWSDAMSFCSKLTVMELKAGRLPKGYVYSLPTEAQWEYACRAGTTTAYNWGDRIDENKANYNYADNWKQRDKSGDTVKRVGSYQPNEWGLFDMHGNVSEWCRDWDGDYPNGPVKDPLGAASSNYRVLRGGCWISSGWTCRSAERACSGSGDRSGFHGFRVALVPAQ